MTTDATGWYSDTPATAPSPTPSPPASAPAPRTAPRRAGAQVIAAALLAAILSSVSTFVLVNAVRPAPAAPATTALTTSTSTSGSGAATVRSNPADASAIASATLPSVVTITTEANVTSPFGGSTQSATGTGSGVILTSDGSILTNYHVVQDGNAFTVRFSDGRTASATVVKTDQQHDLAIIKANATSLTPATLGDSNSVKVGEVVLAFGSPLGDLTGTVTEGIISAKDRTITAGSVGRRGGGETLTGLLQTDAAINPGNSGGPIVDMNGKVIGIAVAGSTNADGLNFAIPIETARSLIGSGG
jgi:S1-C subfamily serine protease